jgi:lipocalin
MVQKTKDKLADISGFIEAKPITVSELDINQYVGRWYQVYGGI